jgi:hypothetical protein
MSGCSTRSTRPSKSAAQPLRFHARSSPGALDRRRQLELEERHRRSSQRPPVAPAEGQRGRRSRSPIPDSFHRRGCIPRPLPPDRRLPSPPGHATGAVSAPPRSHTARGRALEHRSRRAVRRKPLGSSLYSRPGTGAGRRRSEAAHRHRAASGAVTTRDRAHRGAHDVETECPLSLEPRPVLPGRSTYSRHGTEVSDGP